MNRISNLSGSPSKFLSNQCSRSYYLLIADLTLGDSMLDNFTFVNKLSTYISQRPSLCFNHMYNIDNVFKNSFF